MRNRVEQRHFFLAYPLFNIATFSSKSVHKNAVDIFPYMFSLQHVSLRLGAPYSHACKMFWDKKWCLKRRRIKNAEQICSPEGKSRCRQHILSRQGCCFFPLPIFMRQYMRGRKEKPTHTYYTFLPWELIRPDLSIYSFIRGLHEWFAYRKCRNQSKYS